MIFNIQRYSLHDGNGIRTMIFYKGCPLRCQWCSNPESLSFGPGIMYDQRRCKHFGDCVEKGKPAIAWNNGSLGINREAITEPEKLKDVCASKALMVVGKKVSTDDILNEIEKDIPFYHQSGGGVTLSGGEPLSQNGTLNDLLKKIKERNIPVSVETSLHVTWDRVDRCLGLVDCFLVDLKHVEALKFRQFTGGELDLVLKNLQKLDELNENVIIRIPVIPAFNHTEDEMFRIIDYAASLKSVAEVHFIPYHTLGNEKYRMLGMDYPYKGHKSISNAEIMPYIQYANKKGLRTKVGG